MTAPWAERRALSRIAYKTVADALSKLVTLAITVAAARFLSGVEFGVLALAMTTGWLLSVAGDAGLPLYLAKRIARSNAAGQRPSFAPVAEALRIRGALGTIGSAVGLAAAIALAPGASFLAFWIIVVAQSLNAVLETLAHAYRGLGRSEIESTIVMAQRLVTAAAAMGALWWTSSLLLLALALAVPPAVTLVVSVRMARRLLRDDTAAAGTGANSLSPYSHVAAGLGILLSALYFRCDVFFIEYWHGLEAVGTYNAAFRIVEAVRLFPAAVLAVTFPVLCTARDARALRSLLIPLVGGAALVSIAIYVSASLVLGVLYGPRFVEAGPALATLALAIPLFFANYALTHQVIGWDGQRDYLVIVVAALVANVIGNVALIPGLGLQGAAISTVITEVVVTAGCLAAIARLRTDAGLRAATQAQPRGAS